MRRAILWRKRECLRRRTKTSCLGVKSKGQVDIVVSMFLFFIVLIVVLFGFRMMQYMIISSEVEDALAASNLASAIVDLEEYGKTHNIRIPDERAAFGKYREALVFNLQLDSNLNTTRKEFFGSPISIIQYIVYNVDGETVEMVVMNGNGQLQRKEKGRRGTIFTPNGVKVETTGIYSRIGYEAEGLMGQQIWAEKEKYVDITRYNSEKGKE
ncbi:MAG: hypothetical protein IJN16_08585 [Lachnospiraceae bacterium]|nr:hypothetical protein [Lachnospiraceae bacterium]